MASVVWYRVAYLGHRVPSFRVNYDKLGPTTGGKVFIHPFGIQGGNISGVNDAGTGCQRIHVILAQPISYLIFCPSQAVVHSF